MPRRIVTRLTTTEQKEQAELATFYLDRGRRLFQQENDREAVVELNHALYLSPYLADAHFLLGRIHLRNGRMHDAIDAFKIVLWSAETAEAHAALGEAYRQAKDRDGGARRGRARPRHGSRVGRREGAPRPPRRPLESLAEGPTHPLAPLVHSFLTC